MVDVFKLIEMSQRLAPGAPLAIARSAMEAAAAASTRPSAVPPPPRHVEARNLDLVAASLAGGMIAASRREHTAEEAVEVWRRVREAL